MPKLSQVYRSRARRVAISQSQLGREAAIIRAGAREAVQVELYDRTPLKVSGAMLRAIKIQFLGNRFQVGFDSSIAPHAGRRVAMSGTSKTGGHLLDMNPNAYMRRNTYPKVRLLRAASLRAAIGPGVVARL